MQNPLSTEQTYTLLALVCIATAGLVFQILDVIRHEKKEELLEAFWTHLRIYLESRGEHFASYAWLTENAMALQRQMGSGGVFHHFRPAFSNKSFHNYPILINHLPRLHSYLTERTSDISGQADHYRVQIVESMLRHRGELKEQRELAVARIRNPLTWFARGVQLLLALPLEILGAFGILGTATLEVITSSRIFRLIAALAGLVGFVSAIIGIVTGWEPFVQWLRVIVQSK